jgi:hypothetical protein
LANKQRKGSDSGSIAEDIEVEEGAAASAIEESEDDIKESIYESKGKKAN